MNVTNPMPVRDNGKTVAYIVSADDFKRYQKLEIIDENEDKEFAKIAESSLKS